MSMQRHEAAAGGTVRVGTMRVVLMGEGETEVSVASDHPPTVSELLDGLGITSRDGQLYLDGRPATPETPVLPGSEAVMVPRIVGG
jgi:hypothetical protein